MMRLNSRLAPAFAVAATLALAGCATTGGEAGRAPTEVTRYHLDQPIPPGDVAVEQMPGGGGATLEFASYAAAVSRELANIGFAPAANGASSQYIATTSFVRTQQGTIQTPPKFSIGIGGGSFGGGGRRGGGGIGLGGGLSTGFGSKTRDVYMTELFVQLRRRSDGTILWEGRAQRPDMSGWSDAPGQTPVDRLANAMFRGFPGESGITTTVR